MFIEPEFGNVQLNSQRASGWIEVICGSMFSGKTEELIRRLNRAIIARQTVEIFKPATDKRYLHSFVVSHDDNKIRSTPVQFAGDILLLSAKCQVVGIDEGQFFDQQLVETATKLANGGKRVIVSGLDMDYLGKPFSPIQDLMAIAEFVTKMHAVCMKCGSLASHSFRLDNSNEKVVLGDKDKYEALCRKCFFEAQKTRHG